MSAIASDTATLTPRHTSAPPADARFQPGHSPRAPEPRVGESFADALRRSATAPLEGPPDPGPASPRAQGDAFARSPLDALRRSAARPVAGADPVRDAAEQLVAITFIQPVLASLRESNMAAAPFGPGDAERRFSPMWDAAIAQRVVKARGFGLVDAVARHVRKQGAGAPAPGAPAEDPLHALSTNASLDARRIAGAADLGD